MTIQEIEQIEDCARRGLPVDPEAILTLTAYLRDVLQAKINAEAVASEALRKCGFTSRSYSPAKKPKH
jgi:hypothetical protein